MDELDVGMGVISDKVSDGPYRNSIWVSDTNGVSVLSCAPHKSVKLEEDGSFIM